MFATSSLKIILQNSTLFSNSYTDEDAPRMSLRGNVILDIHSALKIKKLYLRFGGKLSMRFPGAFKKTRRCIIDLTVTLFENPRATSISGQHIFPFELLVPSDLPESLRGEFGKIKYTLKAVAETSFINSDLKAVVPVQVQHNPNVQQEFTDEYMAEDVTPDKLACKVTLPTSEYMPGEKFDIQVSTLPLEEGVNVSNVTCVLKEYTRFHISSQSNQTRVLVAEYMKRLNIISKSFDDDDQVKTLIMKTPDDSSYNCINSLVEVMHELVIRIYWEKENNEKDCMTLNIPINIIASANTGEFDQLPSYCIIESPPSYHKTTCLSNIETVNISLPPSYNL